MRLLFISALALAGVASPAAGLPVVDTTSYTSLSTEEKRMAVDKRKLASRGASDLSGPRLLSGKSVNYDMSFGDKR
jgi:hypothetical protein